MTLASDPFGLIAAAGQRAQGAATRNGVAEFWRGAVRFCAAALRDEAAPPTMAQASWQVGFAAMWDQEGEALETEAKSGSIRHGAEFF
jgi:hypothetical protein